MSLFPKSRARIRREASDWVVRLAESASEEERAAFGRWRDADPRHAYAYDRLAAIWNRAGRLSPTLAATRGRTEPSSERPRAFGFALAASLAAAMLLVSVLLLGPRWLPRSEPEAQETMLFAAGLGEIRQVDLPDGSRLVLDSGSRVEAVFAGAERKLTLQEGRARFAVAHEARPFVVRAGNTEVLATGTLFDVSLIGGRTAVLLLEGSVEVRAIADQNRGTRQRLAPGEKLILSPSAPAVRQRTTRGDTVWPARMLEFDDTPLHEAAVHANRYGKIQLRLGDERIGGLRLSGAFRAGDIAGLARSLAAAFDLRLVSQPDGNLLLVGSDPDQRAPAPSR